MSSHQISLPFRSNDRKDGRPVGPIITLRPRQSDWHFAEDILKCILVNEQFALWFKFHTLLIAQWQYGSISSGNRLVPNMQLAITRTHDPVH